MSGNADLDGSRPHLKISGPLLSKLFHEKYKARGVCGGLLYGEIVTHALNEITDSQHTTRTELHARVQDYRNSSASDILKKKPKAGAWIDNASCSPPSTCIGIFKIRKPPASLSLLEKSMHRRLLRHQQHEGSNPEQHKFIVTLLITCNTEGNGTCLTWRISAYVLLKEYFTTIEVDVSNLQGSVSSSYMTGPSPAAAVQSPGTSEILENFQSSLIDCNGQIKVVGVTREATSSLISQLESTFSKLHIAEKKLNRASEERLTLLERLRALEGMKSLRVASSLPSDTPAAPVPKELRVVVDRLESRSQSGAEKMNDDMQTLYESESEYLARRRKSIEDMKKRSAVVVLETINMNKTAEKGEKQKNERSSAAGSDPFTGLVMSAKEKLKSDIAALANEAPDRVRKTETAWDSGYDVSTRYTTGRSQRPPSHKDEG